MKKKFVVHVTEEDFEEIVRVGLRNHLGTKVGNVSMLTMLMLGSDSGWQIECEPLVETVNERLETLEEIVGEGHE